jgi:hypothetical protein
MDHSSRSTHVKTTPWDTCCAHINRICPAVSTAPIINADEDRVGSTALALMTSATASSTGPPMCLVIDINGA